MLFVKSVQQNSSSSNVRLCQKCIENLTILPQLCRKVGEAKQVLKSLVSTKF